MAFPCFGDIRLFVCARQERRRGGRAKNSHAMGPRRRPAMTCRPCQAYHGTSARAALLPTFNCKILSRSSFHILYIKLQYLDIRIALNRSIFHLAADA